jgi:transmembrane sensor
VKTERYINGQTQENEKEWVESLFLNGENNYVLQQLVEKDWNMMIKDLSSSSDVNLSHLQDRIHHTIRKNEFFKKQKPSRKIMSGYMKAAALLLLPVLIAGTLGYRYLNKKSHASYNQQSIASIDQLVTTTIMAPMSARVSFNLPDGTSGMLNSGSRLSYSLPFNKNRQVKLEGEAWFEVTSDAEHPFRISTGNTSVEVLGTSFNMSAYSAENYVELVLQNGKVDFFDNQGYKKATMLPSDRLVYQNGIISKSVTDPVKYKAWTEGQLVFRGDPMTEVARRLEQWYNVDVSLQDTELEKFSFRATFEDEKLDEVLRLLSMTSPIKYSITPGKVLPDGTFEKQKVTIRFKENNPDFLKSNL